MRRLQTGHADEGRDRAVWSLRGSGTGPDFGADQSLSAARAKGQLLGRPKGSFGRSTLDGKEAEITKLLEKDVSKASIAKIIEVSRTALLHFIRSRKLDPQATQARPVRRRA